MGGGGMMRAAAKVAGFTVATGGLRGVTAENYPVSSAARRVVSLRPATASAEDVKLVAAKSQAGVDIDDWEEVMVIAGEPMPRVVFGGVPTLQEAKEATSELTEALEKVYLSSPNSVGYEDPFVSDHESSSSLSNSQAIETKTCVTSDISIATGVPAPALMAFKFLHENSVAQNVVASIACDPNVWDAVLKNQELQGFLQSQSSSCSGFEASANSFDSSSECAESEPVNGFMDIFQKIKISVVDMMSSLSGYLQSFFGGQGESKAYVDSDGTAKLSGDTVMGASFMGLAIMAIMVIVLKRA